MHHKRESHTKMSTLDLRRNASVSRQGSHTEDLRSRQDSMYSRGFLRVSDEADVC